MSNCVVFIISLLLSSTTVFQTLIVIQRKRIAFDLRYCSMDEVIHYINDKLEDVLD